MPYKYWVGDLKPMYIVTYYYYPFEKISRKWSSANEKYNFGDQLYRNPQGVLNINEEGEHYRLYNRLYRLTEQFIGRCQ